jgi:hypothetical protein
METVIYCTFVSIYIYIVINWKPIFFNDSHPLRAMMITRAVLSVIKKKKKEKLSEIVFRLANTTRFARGSFQCIKWQTISLVTIYEFFLKILHRNRGCKVIPFNTFYYNLLKFQEMQFLFFEIHDLNTYTIDYRHALYIHAILENIISDEKKSVCGRILNRFSMKKFLYF